LVQVQFGEFLITIQDYIIIKFSLKKYINLMRSLSFFTQRHAFHLVDPSAMPLLTSIAAFTLLLGASMYFHGYIMGFETAMFGFFSVIACMFF
jgi:hypothetical protein